MCIEKKTNKFLTEIIKRNGKKIEKNYLMKFETFELLFYLNLEKKRYY